MSHPRLCLTHKDKNRDKTEIRINHNSIYVKEMNQNDPESSIWFS